MRLVEDAPARALAVLGYPSMVEAADAVPSLLVSTGSTAGRGSTAGGARPTEGWSPVRGWTRASSTWCGRNGGACRTCHAARAGCSPRSPPRRARRPSRLRARCSRDAGAVDGRVVADPAEMAALWRIREDGAGLAARSPDPAGVLRLGGRSGPAGAARRLPPRVRRPAQAVRPGRCALRALRGRLRARSDRLRVRGPGPPVPRVPARLGSAGRGVRRFAVRRARRRQGQVRATAADVRRAVDQALRGSEGDLRPRQPAQPRRARRPGSCRRRSAARAAGPLPAAVAAAHPRRRFAWRCRAPLHRSRQMSGRQYWRRRRDVPVVPRDEGREGLHAGPGPGAPRGPRRNPGRRSGRPGRE